VSVDLRQPDTGVERRSPSRRWGWILIASTVWTLYVWITRGYNIARSSNTTSFKIAHYVLAVISIGFALAVGTIGVRLLKRKS
jgi:hypothetical protein